MADARPLFIVNPAAGNGRAASALANASFTGPADIVHTSAPGDAERLTHQATLDGFSPVVAVGGDGTVQEVVNGLMRAPQPPPLGIVAAGGGNDAVRSLRLPKNHNEAIRLAWSSHSRPIDLGRCNDRYFLNVAGVGLDTQVAAAVNASDGRFAHGKAGYIVQALKELRHYVNAAYRITLDGEVVETEAILVAVANLRYFAGGMKIAPNADPTDGLLDVWIGRNISRLEALMLFPAIFAGQHGRHPRVTHHRVKSVTIESDTPLDVQLDGEIVETLPATFDVVPSALRIAGLRG
jgi:diacylglycerol kinase (ATP)